MCVSFYILNKCGAKLEKNFPNAHLFCNINMNYCFIIPFNVYFHYYLGKKK